MADTLYERFMTMIHKKKVSKELAQKMLLMIIASGDKDEVKQELINILETSRTEEEILKIIKCEIV